MSSPLRPLGEIAKIVMGQSPPGSTYNREKRGEPLLNGPAEFGPRYPVTVQWTTEPTRFADAGDILFCVRGATTGRKCWADRRYAVGRGLAAIRGRDGVCDTRFLWFLLDVVTQSLLKRAAGSTFINLPGEEILRFRVPLPPLSDQQRIAGRLTERVTIVERARAAARSRLAAAQALPAAYLREVFEGRDWPEMLLCDGLRAIEAGTSVQSLERAARDGEWGVLKVSAVSWGRFKAEENKAVPPGFVPMPHEHVKLGDLLISRANTQELAGAVVLVRQTPKRLMLSDKTLRLVLREDILDSAYLEYAIRTRSARKFIEHNATGSSYSMRNISQDTIRAIPLPVPPIDEQRRIAADLSHRLSEAERVTGRIAEEFAAIEALPAALLRAAFAGGGGNG